MLSVEVFFVLFAPGDPEDLRRNLGLAAVVGQGGQGKVGQFPLREPEFLANEHAQRHDVDRVELRPLLLLVTQQVQQDLFALGNGGGRLLRQLGHLFAGHLGRPRHVQQGLARRLSRLLPGPVGPDRSVLLASQLGELALLQQFQLLGDGDLLLRELGRFSARGLQFACRRRRRCGTLVGVVVQAPFRVERPDDPDVLLRPDQEPARQERVFVPLEVQPDVQPHDQLRRMYRMMPSGLLPHGW